MPKVKTVHRTVLKRADPYSSLMRYRCEFKNNHFTEMWCGFRGGLVFKAHRLLYHSTSGSRVMKKKKKKKKKVPLRMKTVPFGATDAIASGSQNRPHNGFIASYTIQQSGATAVGGKRATPLQQSSKRATPDSSLAPPTAIWRSKRAAPCSSLPLRMKTVPLCATDATASWTVLVSG